MDNLLNMSSEAFSWDDIVWESLLDELKNRPVDELLSSHEADLDTFTRPFTKYSTQPKTKRDQAINRKSSLTSDTSSRPLLSTPSNYKKQPKTRFKKGAGKRIKSTTTDYFNSDSILLSSPNSFIEINHLKVDSDIGNGGAFSLAPDRTKGALDIIPSKKSDVKVAGFSKKWSMTENKLLLKEVRRLYLLGFDVKDTVEGTVSSDMPIDMWEDVALGFEKVGFTRSGQQCYKRWRIIYKHLGDKIMDYIQDRNSPLSPNEIKITHPPLSKAERLSIAELQSQTPQASSLGNKLNLNSNETAGSDTFIVPCLNTQQSTIRLDGLNSKNKISPGLVSANNLPVIPNADSLNQGVLSTHNLPKISIDELEHLFLGNDRFKSKFYSQLVTDVVEAIENPFSKPGMAVKRAKWQHEQDIENMRTGKKALDSSQSTLGGFQMVTTDLADPLNTNYPLGKKENISDMVPRTFNNSSSVDANTANIADQSSKKRKVENDLTLKSAKPKLNSSNLILPKQDLNDREQLISTINLTKNQLSKPVEINLKNSSQDPTHDLTHPWEHNNHPLDASTEMEYYLEFIQSLVVPDSRVNNNPINLSFGENSNLSAELGNILGNDKAHNQRLDFSKNNITSTGPFFSEFYQDGLLNDKEDIFGGIDDDDDDDLVDEDFVCDDLDEVDKSDEEISESENCFNSELLTNMDGYNFSSAGSNRTIQNDFNKIGDLTMEFLDKIDKNASGEAGVSFSNISTVQGNSINDLVQKIVDSNQVDAMSLLNSISYNDNNSITQSFGFGSSHTDCLPQNKETSSLISNTPSIHTQNIDTTKAFTDLNFLANLESTESQNNSSKSQNSHLTCTKNNIASCNPTNISGLENYGYTNNNQLGGTKIQQINTTNPVILTKPNTLYQGKIANSIVDNNLVQKITQQLIKKYSNTNNIIPTTSSSSTAITQSPQHNTINPAMLKDFIQEITASLLKNGASSNIITSNDPIQAFSNTKSYNVLSNSYQSEPDTPNVDTDLESLYQEALQAGEEINYKNEPQSIDDGDFLFTEEQMNTLRHQQQENLQLVLQSYLIECFQNGPHTGTALHWKDQLLNIYNTSNKNSKTYSADQPTEFRNSETSFLFIPGVDILVPFILYLVADIHCTFQVSEPTDIKTLKAQMNTANSVTDPILSIPSKDLHIKSNINQDLSLVKTEFPKVVDALNAKAAKKPTPGSSEKNDISKTEKNKLKSTMPIPIAPLPSNVSAYKSLYSYAQAPNNSYFVHFKKSQIPSNSMQLPIIPSELSYNPEFLLKTTLVKNVTNSETCKCVSQTMPTHPFLLEHVLPNVYSQFVNKNGYMYKTPENVLMNFYTFETKAACKVIIDQLLLFSNKAKRFQSSRKKHQNASSNATTLTNDTSEHHVLPKETLSQSTSALQNQPTFEESANITDIISASAFPKFAQFILTPILYSLKWNYSLYPQIQASRRFKNRVSFLPQEDSLILLALSLFGFDDTASMSAHLLPCKTPSQISNRIQNLRARRAPANQVKDFCLQRIVPLNLVQEEAIKAGIFIYGKDFKESAVEFLGSWPRSVIRRVLDSIMVSISEED